ncbi:family 10 glycosylhydrolase [Flaviaesturariibacter amylovorans]|uniref:Family 10 glycosylhydrolase n=1 Tax=Flaviaesturariibacter amylovorans TaxID=1084520 RepID=A0ABP8GR91_9BACT
MLRLLCSLALLLATFSPHAQKTLKREVRGAWITTYAGLDWPVRTQTPTQQRAALLTQLDHHRATGMNTVYFQVRSQSDAMYPSTLEPWSYDLTGAQGVAPNPAWDPLQFALEQSRQRGFEFHAWINPFRAVANTANASNNTLYSAGHISRTQPGWMLTVGTVQIINPGIPAARAHILSVITDILRRYDVDGIHFDDYFYPSGTINDDAAYTADPRGFPNTTAGRADWRRDNINLFIQGVYDSVRTIKPWVKFGVSPSGIYRSSTDPNIGSNTSSGALQHYSAYFADSKKWLQQGWVDYIAPQLYWYRGQTGSDYDVLVPWWNNNAFGRHIYIGVASYKVNDPAQGANWANPAQLPGQVRMNRSALYPNVHGSLFFRTQHLIGNALGHRDSLKNDLFKRPALQPRMPWRDEVGPEPPTAGYALLEGDSIIFAWGAPPATADPLQQVRQYAIYRNTTAAVDTSDPGQLVGIVNGDVTRFRDTTIPGGPGFGYFYAVTALDRFHNESRRSEVRQVAALTSVSSRNGLDGALLVYPNPTRGAFYVRLTAPRRPTMQVRVLNALGQLVEQRAAVPSGSPLRLGDGYRPGLYFLEVSTGTGRQHATVIIGR